MRSEIRHDLAPNPAPQGEFIDNSPEGSEESARRDDDTSRQARATSKGVQAQLMLPAPRSLPARNFTSWMPNVTAPKKRQARRTDTTLDRFVSTRSTPAMFRQTGMMSLQATAEQKSLAHRHQQTVCLISQRGFNPLTCKDSGRLGAARA